MGWLACVIKHTQYTVNMPTVPNAVVNGVLCYISTARRSYNEAAIVSVCQSFYSYELVSEAKKVLFGLTGENVTHRRGEGKLKADLNDIIAEFIRIDENRLQIPNFVADDYRSIPPASGFEVISEHIVALMIEVNKLKDEVNSLKNTPGNNVESVIDIKEDLHDIKNMMVRKSVTFGQGELSNVKANQASPAVLGRVRLSPVVSRRVRTSRVTSSQVEASPAVSWRVKESRVVSSRVRVIPVVSVKP